MHSDLKLNFEQLWICISFCNSGSCVCYHWHLTGCVELILFLSSILVTAYGSEMKGLWKACTISEIPIESHSLRQHWWELHVASANWDVYHGSLARNVILWVAHAPGIPGTFSPPPRVSDPDIPHGTCVTHVPWCMPGSLTSGLFWSGWWGNRSRHSRRMRNRQFYVSGKRPM